MVHALPPLTLGFWPNDIPEEWISSCLTATPSKCWTQWTRDMMAMHMFDESSWVRLQTTSLPPALIARTTIDALVLHSRTPQLSDYDTLRRLAFGPGGVNVMFYAVLSPEIGSGPAVGHLLSLRQIELDLYELDETASGKWSLRSFSTVQDVARRWRSGEGRSLLSFKDRCQVTRRAVWAIKVIHPREWGRRGHGLDASQRTNHRINHKTNQRMGQETSQETR
jgi:hypothetical protein